RRLLGTLRALPAGGGAAVAPLHGPGLLDRAKNRRMVGLDVHAHFGRHPLELLLSTRPIVSHSGQGPVALDRCRTDYHRLDISTAPLGAGGLWLRSLV